VFSCWRIKTFQFILYPFLWSDCHALFFFNKQERIGVH
jgi:hypothetical protein